MTPQDTLFRENSLLFLLLMLGTLWLAVTLYNFNQTPYLQVLNGILKVISLKVREKESLFM